MHGRARAALAVAAAGAAGEAALVLLRPRGRPVLPEPVAQASYFTPAEVARARRFRRGQRAIGAVGAAVELGALAALARTGPSWGPRIPPRGRPAAASALTAAGLGLGLGIATLPLDALGRRRAVRAGLATGTWRAWAADQAKAAGVGAAVAAAGGAGATALRRRAGERWWLPAAGLGVGAAALAAIAAPVLLEPLFLRFDPVDDEDLRGDVLRLADRSGVRVKDVLVADASRRTTGANAYVSGLGATRRVVLFDTLLSSFAPDEVRLVVAHELSHVRHRDVLRSLALMALTALPVAYAVARATDEVPDGPGALPALALAAGAASAVLTPAAARLSRAVEVRADTDALWVAGAAPAFAAFHRRLALQNLVEPQPPRLRHALTATHPTTLERIALAERFAAQAAPH